MLTDKRHVSGLDPMLTVIKIKTHVSESILDANSDKRHVSGLDPILTDMKKLKHTLVS